MAERKAFEVRVREGLHGNASEAAVWLRLNYARLRRRMAVRFPPYAEVAAEMNAAGVTGRVAKGREPHPVTADTVYRIWRGILVERAGKRRGKPSRAGPAGWTPTVVASAPKPAPRTEPDPPAGGDGGGGYLAALKAEVNRRSGRR